MPQGHAHKRLEQAAWGLSKCYSVTPHFPSPNRDHLSEGKFEGKRFGLAAKRLAALRAIDPIKPHVHLSPILEQLDGVSIGHTHDLAAKLLGRGTRASHPDCEKQACPRDPSKLVARPLRPYPPQRL